MLDKDSSDQTESTTDSTATEAVEAVEAKPARRRRRAASRPAGPPVAAETDEPGEVRSSAASSDPIFDAPWSDSNRDEGERGRQPIVSDPFAVPAIDMSGLRPPSSDDEADEAGSDAGATEQPATEQPATGSTSRARSRTRSGAKSTASKSTAKSTASKSAASKSAASKSTESKSAASKSTSTRSTSRRSGSTKSGDTPDADSSAASVTDDTPVDEVDTDQSADATTGGPRTDDAKVDDANSDAAQVDDVKVDDVRTAAADQSASSGDEDNSADDQASSSDDQDSSSDDQDSGDGSGRRRRRRRGGRRRRRSGGDDGADDSSDDSGAAARTKSDDSADGPSGDGSSNDSNDSDGDSSGGRRRRRRRRRGGEDADETARRRANAAVTGIDGSTRLEAKRQRRREGREAGRRRAPILSEAEFLARRESVRRAMVIRQRESMSQIAVLEDDVLVEHYVDHSSTRSLIGNVYLGKVQNVLPSMEAAFIDIGQGRNAVLYAGEVDWDVFSSGGGNKERKIESVLKSGQSVLVQVTKDPIGAKGARLTHHVSLPGRYIVYSPGGHLSGISRKLPDTERKRLKKVLSDHVDDSASVIVRTAAEGASEDELVRDVTRLKSQWDAIEKKVKNGGAPKLMHAEPDPTVRIVRDLFTEDFAELVIAGNGNADDAHDNIMEYVEQVAPHLAGRVQRWDGAGDKDVFTAHRIDEQIARALERKVHLPSGGSLVIDRTEAMTVVDVNTGKFTGSGGNLEATVTSNNLEAAEEIVRQLRLRDIGGIIVIDFIDMVLPNNRELLLRRLVECLGRDRTRHQVAEVTSLGLVQMTRKRIGTGLGEAFTTPCEHCQGKGHTTHDEPVEVQPDNSNGNGGNTGGGRGRGRTRGGRGSKAKSESESESESPKTPPRQPLPKVMPPPPPGLARVTGTDEHSEDGDVEGTAAEVTEPGDTTQPEQKQPEDQQPEEKQPEEKQPEDERPESTKIAAAKADDTSAVDTGSTESAGAVPADDPVAAAMDALVAGTRAGDA